MSAACQDCGRPYGDEHGFPDLVVPHEVWNKYISPNGDQTGLLCPSCMCKRAHDAGLKDVPAVFRSGPFRYEPIVELVDAAPPPQENFFDAVRADPDMTAEQKAKWLAYEPPASPPPA